MNATNPTQLLKSPRNKRGKRSRNFVFVDDFDVLSEIQFRISIFRKKSANNTKAATHFKKEYTFSLGT
jgi:hypothetical protein